MNALIETAKALVRRIEAVGCVDYRDASGRRIKDSAEWAAFYVAVKNAPQAGEAAAEVERLRADLEQCQRDLQVMTELRDEARYERNRLRERLSAAIAASDSAATPGGRDG